MVTHHVPPSSFVHFFSRFFPQTGVKVIKDDCEADLAEAMPAYESAVRALDSLDKKSIQELKVSFF